MGRRNASLSLLLVQLAGCESIVIKFDPLSADESAIVKQLRLIADGYFPVVDRRIRGATCG